MRTGRHGRVAQMVERTVSIREVGGSMPPMSITFCLFRLAYLRGKKGRVCMFCMYYRVLFFSICLHKVFYTDTLAVAWNAKERRRLHRPNDNEQSTANTQQVN